MYISLWRTLARSFDVTKRKQSELNAALDHWLISSVLVEKCIPQVSGSVPLWYCVPSFEPESKSILYLYFIGEQLHLKSSY